MQWNGTRLGRRWMAAMAIMLAMLVLVSDGLSVSPALHHRLHEDSGNVAHQCAITLFSQHNVLLDMAPLVLVILVAGFCRLLSISQTAVYARVDSRLAPSRAPPGNL